MAEQTRQTAPPGPLTLCLAGEFRLLRDGVPVNAAEIGSRKGRQLLKLLAVARPTHLSAEAIADTLWGDDPPRRPAENVATLVSRLRANLGADAIERNRGGYRLGFGINVDLDLASDRLNEARRRAAASEPGLALAAVTAAVDQVRTGVALADEPDAVWAEPARVELRQILLTARQLGGDIAFELDDYTAAAQFAEAAITADPYDEEAYRLAMRVDATAGRPARALARFDALRTRLADDFGVDPAPQTRDLHLTILREEKLATPPPLTSARPRQPTPMLAGRDDELDRLATTWSQVANGQPAVVLLVGEAGIGKTRLATELTGLAVQTGGTVLTARCYETERSLFLQPIVEALSQHAGRTPPERIRSLAGDDAAQLALLVPEFSSSLSGPTVERLSPEIQLARVYRAVANYLIRMATQPPRPVLMFLDDLHQAGLATTELLHHLIRQAGAAPIMVVATVRAEEGAPVLTALRDVADVIEVGPLSDSAVGELARDIGRGELAASIVARTGGHALFVVEILQALAAGESGIPASLTAAVLARVGRTGLDDLLRAAAVLGSSIEPELLARLLDASAPATAQRCEAALQARLLVVADRAYEFAHDLVREVLYRSIPEPTRLAYHRRAADLLEARPEALAPHAAAIGDRVRAGRAWLFAGEDAFARLAASDADELLSNALAEAESVGDLEVAGRALLTRGRVREQMAAFSVALDDYSRSVAIARRAGDRRLEMLALQARGGDPKVALGHSIDDTSADMSAALRLAASFGDRQVEVALLARLGVVACNRLDFVAGLDYGLRAVRTARASGEPQAIAAALDGLKTAYAYLGQVGPLAVVLDELIPLLRDQGDTARLQWAVDESAFLALARGDWSEAVDVFSAAVDINERSGYRSYESWFLSHLGWAHRLAGDIDAALEVGHRALDSSAGLSVWFRAACCSELGITLLAAQRIDDAYAVLAEGRDLATRAGAESYLVRCLGPLAEATAIREPGFENAALLASECERRLGAISVPGGSAWVLGVETYFSLARAWRALDRPDRAAALLAPFQAAAKEAGWSWIADTAG